MGSYVQDSLIQNETVVYETRISHWSLFHFYLCGLILLPVFGLGLIFFLAAYIKSKTTELAVTNKRVIAKSGFISRTTIELNLPKAETVQVVQSVFGRMFNYGSISIAGGGNPQVPIPGIDNPMDFRRAFLSEQEQSLQKDRMLMQQGMMAAAVAAMQPPMPQSPPPQTTL